jgi:adenylate cyclase
MDTERDATFCFADLAGFTALTEAHGDNAAADLVDRFTALVEECLGASARLLDVIGDAVLVVGDEPEAALAFVARLFTRVDGEANFPVLRAGLHHGPILERDGRFFGATLNLTARVAAEARGGQVVATAIVAERARNFGVETISLGRFALKNVRVPVELFSLSLSGTAAASVVDPVCRMRMEPDRAPGHLRHENQDYWFCSFDCVAKFVSDPESYTQRLGTQG